MTDPGGKDKPFSCLRAPNPHKSPSVRRANALGTRLLPQIFFPESKHRSLKTGNGKSLQRLRARGLIGLSRGVFRRLWAGSTAFLS